jgi:hypothetical protein
MVVGERFELAEVRLFKMADFDCSSSSSFRTVFGERLRLLFAIGAASKCRGKEHDPGCDLLTSRAFMVPDGAKSPRSELLDGGSLKMFSSDAGATVSQRHSLPSDGNPEIEPQRTVRSPDPAKLSAEQLLSLTRIQARGPMPSSRLTIRF